MFKCLWVCGRRIMRNVGSGTEEVSVKRVCVNPKVSVRLFSPTNVTVFSAFLFLLLIRCDGAARALAPCVQHPGPTLPHAASRCVLPIPVSTATGAVRSPAAPAAPASAPEPPVATTPAAVSHPAAGAQGRARGRHAAPRRSQRTGQQIKSKNDCPTPPHPTVIINTQTSPFLTSFSLWHTDFLGGIVGTAKFMLLKYLSVSFTSLQGIECFIINLLAHESP